MATCAVATAAQNVRVAGGVHRGSDDARHDHRSSFVTDLIVLGMTYLLLALGIPPCALAVVQLHEWWRRRG